MKKNLLFLQFVIASLICQAQAPNWLWAVGATGSSCYETGFGIGAGPSGNIYFSGRFPGTITLGGKTTAAGSDEDFSGKMDSAGSVRWLNSHSQYGGFDYNYAFAIDDSENNYTAGIINSGGSGSFVDKYDSAGNLIWYKTNPGGAAYGVGSDNKGNTYESGYFDGSITFGPTTLTSKGDDDIFLVKYNGSGNVVWAVSAGGTGKDEARGVVADKSGNVYICGGYSGTATFGSITPPAQSGTYTNFFIAKYDSSGNAQWVAPATNSEFVNGAFYWNWNGLAIDSCANLYVTGHYMGTAQFGSLPSITSVGSGDIFVAKCLADGQWEWVQSAGGPSDDEGLSIALDKHSDVYVTGYFEGTAQFGSISLTTLANNATFVAKYANSNGDLLWAQSPIGSGNSDAQGITVDNQGYVYIIGNVSSPGETFGSSTVTDNTGCGSIFIAKLDTVPHRTITPFVNANYCPGETVILPYTITGTFNNGNTFTAQLSNISGSFVSSTFLGDTLSNDSGAIIITIPDTVSPGSNYLIRVVSDSPSTSSWANGCGTYFVNNVYVNNFYVTIGNTLAVSVYPTDSSICSGGSILLGAYGGNGLTYKWTNNGDTTVLSSADTIIVNPTDTTTYYVTVSNGTCSGKDSIIINVTPSPPLTIEPVDTAFCSGQSATLFVNGGGIGFIWSPTAGLSDSTASGDSVLASPTITTTYMVTGTSFGGCASSGTDIVTVIPSPNTPTFTQDGDTLISSSKYDNQWYRNDSLLVNDTSQHLIITILGEYLVNVTNEANGCSTSSDSMKVDSITGIHLLSAISNQLLIYPNPFNNDIFIKINSSAENVNDWNLRITDVLGRTIYGEQSLNYSNDIDLSNLANGVYFITVINKTGRAVFPMVKQN